MRGEHALRRHPMVRKDALLVNFVKQFVCSSTIIESSERLDEVEKKRYDIDMLNAFIAVMPGSQQML